jgi:DNA repair photolyase
MRFILSTVALCLLLPIASAAAQDAKYYKWVDKDGNVHFGDSIPPEYAEQPKQVLNDQGVTVEHLEGKKTAEQILAEKRAAELEAQIELQNRADQALLATYVNVDEIIMHRDRRVELYQAQARVTELYLRNAQRRLNSLERDARRYKPYNSDPNAPTIDESLLNDIEETKSTIRRQENNLGKYKASQEQIIARFEGDINRFKTLKGIE